MKKNLFWLGLALCAGFVMTSCDDDDDLGNGGVKDLADDQPAAMVTPNGFYVANEDWAGHDNGSINYFKRNGNEYDINYRVYRAANSGEKLGGVTEYASIWGDNVYMLSKNDLHLVVASAKDFRKKAEIKDFGAEAHQFLGIDDKKAYVSFGDNQRGGIAKLNLNNFSQVENIQGINEQIGNMCLSNGMIFALGTENLYIINAQTDLVVKEIPGSFRAVTVDKDGDVWVASNNGFVKYDSESLETETVPYPENGEVYGTEWAWNANSLCASTQENCIYWLSGASSWVLNSIWKYDVDNKQAVKLYEITACELEQVPSFYGAGLRVDPVTDELIALAVLNFKQSFVYKIDNKGKELGQYALLGDNGTANLEGGYYFWFPALPFFEDANQPQILLNQVKVKVGETEEVDLDEKVVDYDNIFASMMFELTPAESNQAQVMLDGDDLKVKGVQPGVTACKLAVISNGVRVEKNIQIVVE